MTLRIGQPIVALLIVVATSASCSNDSSTGPDPAPGAQSSSATHFLEDCGTTCPSGLECICGTCTRACISSTACADIAAEATCASTAAAHPSCGTIPVGFTCDVACSSDKDCAGIPSAHHCAAGFCRSTARSERSDAGSNGGSAGSNGSNAGSNGGNAGSNGGANALDGGAGGSGGRNSSSGGTSASGGAAGADAGQSGGAGGAFLPNRPPVVSGTRLKARYTTASDGARLYRRQVLYDSALAADCQYQVASDGKLRCLPVVPPTGQNAIVYYADSGCTDLYALLAPPPTGCAPAFPKYVFAATSNGSACAEVYGDHVYEVEGTVIPSAGIFRWNGTACESVNAGYPDTIPVRLRPESPAATFVEGTTAEDP